jgi:hypothetical protein
MNKYRLTRFVEGTKSTVDIDAHYFTSITVPSRVASTTVTFYDVGNSEIYMFAHVISVEKVEE